MKHDHRLSAPCATLQDKIFTLGAGDDFVLFFLNRLYNILDGGFFFAIFYDLPEIRIKKNFFVASADFFVRQVIPYGEKFVFEIQNDSVLCAESPAKHSLIIIFVDGKGNMALLIIFPRQRSAPIDNFELHVSLFSDIVTVIAFFRVS